MSIGKTKKKTVYELFHGRCAYCGKELTLGTIDCTVDHIVPKIKGGSSDIDNLALACHTCNCLKNNRTLLEFQEVFGKKFFAEALLLCHDHELARKRDFVRAKRLRKLVAEIKTIIAEIEKDCAPAAPA